MKTWFKKNPKQALTLLIVSLALVAGVVGYRLTHQEPGLSNAPASQLGSDLPEQVNSPAEINQLYKALEETSLDSELDAEQFDSEIEALL